MSNNLPGDKYLRVPDCEICCAALNRDWDRDPQDFNAFKCPNNHCECFVLGLPQFDMDYHIEFVLKSNKYILYKTITPTHVRYCIGLIPEHVAKAVLPLLEQEYLDVKAICYMETAEKQNAFIQKLILLK